MPTVLSASYEFGPYRISATERILYRGQHAIKLPPKIIETLFLLAENPTRIIEKEEFLQRLWPDTFVEEINLARNISLLRKTLSEGTNGQQFIETIPKRGYRFLVEVKCSLPPTHLTEAEAPATLHADETAAPSPEAEALLDFSSIVPPTAESTLRGEKHLRTRYGLLLTFLLLGLILLGLLSGSWFRFAPENPFSSVKSLAVLPIKLTGVEAETDYIGFGITDVLISKLGSLRDLSVRPTNAITKYTETDAMVAGRALKVDAVITGHAYLSGNRLRVLAQMVRVSNNQILWSGTFDGEVDNLFALQDTIAIQLANVLTPQASGAAPRITPRRSSIPEAQTNYLKGRYFEDRREWNKAFQSYQEATQADPQLACAWAGMARAYCFGGGGFNEPLIYMPKAKECALKALQLDDGLAEAHAVLGTILENHDWDWAGAEQEYRKALALDPNCTAAHFAYGECLAFEGRFEEAVAEVRRVLDTDPLSLAVSNNVGTIHYYARRYDQAIEWCQKTLQLNPQHPVAYQMLGAIYEKKGMRQESLLAYIKAKELSGEAPEVIATLKQIVAESGWTGYWRRELAIAQARQAKDFYPAYLLATIYARLGEKEKAKQSLHEAFADRALMTALKIDPILDEVRGDPEIKALIVKIGLSSESASHNP